MSEIVYPNSICTLNQEELLILDGDGRCHSVIHYPSVQCTSLVELVNVLNRNDMCYKFSLISHQHYRLQLIVKPPYTVIMDQTLSDILCFDQSRIPHNLTPTLSSDEPSLTRHVDYLYVYTTIGQFVLVGDVKVPLLRYFPFATSTSPSIQSKVFMKRLYVGVNQSQIEHIDVSIRDDAGELVPFFDHDVTTQLTLHFRRRRRHN